MNIAGAFGRLLHRFCDVIGLPELPADPRFDTSAKRSANRAELNRLIAERLAAAHDRGVGRAPQRGGRAVRAGLRTDEVFADPHVAHLGMVATVASPALGDRRHPPQRGDDGRRPADRAHGHPRGRASTPTSVLGELGLDGAEIDDLRRRGVVS